MGSVWDRKGQTEQLLDNCPKGKEAQNLLKKKSLAAKMGRGSFCYKSLSASSK